MITKGLYFIAEIGQNHNGSIETAKKMIDSLVGTGVKAIKTAKRDIETCLTDDQKKMIYDNKNSFGKTYLEHRQALEFSKDEFIELKNYAESKGFDFISSYTDIPSLYFLKEIGIEILKIASQRITDIKLLKHTRKIHKGQIIMSSGMSTYANIDKMIEIFKNNEKYLLQCSSVYPSIEKHLNLRVLRSYKQRYKEKVDGFGFSGHNTMTAPDIAAYMLGARIIERHYTLDRNMKGTDHQASLVLDDIKSIMSDLKSVKKSLGKKEKQILPDELPAIEKLRGDL